MLTSRILWINAWLQNQLMNQNLLTSSVHSRFEDKRGRLKLKDKKVHPLRLPGLENLFGISGEDKPSAVTVTVSSCGLQQICQTQVWFHHIIGRGRRKWCTRSLALKAQTLRRLSFNKADSDEPVDIATFAVASGQSDSKNGSASITKSTKMRQRQRQLAYLPLCAQRV